MWDKPSIFDFVQFNTCNNDIGRIIRLKLVASFIIGMASVEAKIDCRTVPFSVLNDHKGTLIIEWNNQKLKEAYSNVASIAWAIVGGEPSQNVVNKVLKYHEYSR